DADVIVVGGARCCGPIVRFQNRGALIYVTETEEAKFAGRFGEIDWHRVRAIEEVDVEFPHGVYLVDTARWARPEEREISSVRIESKLRAIVAAADSGKAKIADEALRDPRADERRQRFVFGRDFGAV